MEHGERRVHPPAARPFGRRSTDRIALTARQRQILDGVSQGLENKEIAAQLGISEQAVKQQVSVLLQKFAVPSRAMLVQHAMVMRLIGRPADAIDFPLEHFFESAPILMAFTDGPQHKIRLVNHEFRRFFGERDYIGRTIGECFPGTTEALIGTIDRVYRRGEEWRDAEREIRFALPDGTRREAVLSLVVEPLRGSEGDVTGLAFYAWDVTAHINEHRHLERLSAEQEALLEQLPVGVIYTDARARPVLVNPVARRILREDFDPGRPLYDALEGWEVRYVSTGERMEPSNAPSARAIQGWPFDDDVLIANGHGAVRVHISARPIHDRKGNVTGAMLVFTERTAIEDAISAARKRASEG